MKKNLFIVLLLILCNFSVITIKANYKDENIDHYICENSDLMYDDILCRKEVSKNTLRPIMTENKYILTDVIELTFSLETTDYSTISSIDYNLDGFESDEIISNEPRISFLSNNYSISGTLQWQDDSGNIHPLQYIYVSLYCANDSYDNQLRTTYTDQNGFYNFTISSSSGSITSDNLYIKVRPIGTNVTVDTGTGGNYIWRSSIYDKNISGNNITINRTFNMRNIDDLIDGVAGDGDLGRAFQISQALIYADKFAAVMNGSSLNRIRACYPVSDSTDYHPFWKRIDLLGIESDYDYADWDVIFHEYGHHVQNILGNANSPGGQHSSYTDLSLTYGIDEGTRLAWGEAWPTIFGEIAQQYYSTCLSSIAGVADGGYTDSGNRIYSYPLPSFKYNEISNILYNNEAIERAIMGVLYDLYDNDSNELHDNVVLGARGWWSATVVSGITTFTNFSDQYYSSLNKEIDKINYCKLVQYYGMPATLYDYTTNGTIILAKYKLVGDCSIPKKIFNYIIYSIGEEAFKNQSLLTSVEMFDSSITNIDSNAFENCISLINIMLPNGLYAIGTSAFKGCANLSIITLPSSVAYIDSSAFENCTYLQNVTLSNALTSISNSVFKGCTGLTNIMIPDNITNIDSSAFENCTYLQNVTLSNSLTSIGNSVFKGCTSLTNITIPDNVTNIDSSAFENCILLSNVILPNSLQVIGISAFRGCTSLSSITIPNSVTNIDSNAFENCTGLSNITLSNNLYAIGTSAFKGCTNLSSVTLPISVQYIDDAAFRNCSSLSYVTVQKETSPITNLGQNVFIGCDSNLEINVPINRLIEYKNKEYWSSYRNKITSVGTFEEINIDCETSISVNYNLQQGLNKCYKINVDCVKSYRISVISNNDVSIKLYNENMAFVNENINVLDEYLNVGTYYVLFEYENIELNGLINVDFSLRWPNNFIQIGYNVDTNMLSNIHNTAINTKHGKFCYLNNQGEGLYKITLNAGNITYPVESLKIYTDSNRTNLLDKYNNPEETTYATSLENENVMFVYLPSNGYYYIDVALPSNNYSSVKLKIEKAEANNIDYSSRLASVGFDDLFEVNSSFSNFEEVTISHRSKIQLDVVTNGSISQNIKVVVLQKLKEPGYEPGDNHYYNVVKFEDYITATNRFPVFDIIFDSGTYYIGFINNSNHVSISMALRRLVNQEVDINNTLVADPATNEGYTLGSEVTVNNGMCNSDTITEGFTRCIYLMVENRFTEPMSRLEYDWYSSNDNVAIVTAYGTVIAKSVNVDTEVTIYAVLKTDPSIVYQKTFTIVNDEKTYETDPLDYYLTMTVEVKENKLINLSSLNVPIDMTQYYNWSGSPLLNINYWGYIYAEPTAQGMTFEVVGTYRLNSRVRIHVTVYVN